MITRRQFLTLSATAGTGLFVPWKALGGMPSYVFAAGSPNLTKFLDPLLNPIPKLTPIANPAYPGADYYEITMTAGTHKFHSQLGPATTWGYGGIPYLGPTIEAKQGKPVVVKFINNLPTNANAHPLHASVDPTVPDPDNYPGLADGRAIPHLHGGFTAPQFDGHPFAWFTADGGHGSHYNTLPGADPNEAIFEYSNQQPAANLWYHDHAMGITRLNVYAGLAALYILRDAFDTGVVGQGLNLPKGAYEVPLVIQDKQFNPDGSLFYPTTSGLPAPYPHPIWVPEFFGDTPVVNGTAYPFLAVEPRRYRLRLLNGSQARFYNLWFDDPKKGPIPVWLIGTEQSLLPAPVPFTKLLLAPAERADVIIDFSTVPPGTIVTLMNNAKAPYPGGRGGAINQIMQFRVTLPLAGPDTTTPPAQLVLPAVPRLTPTPSAPLREIVMRETEDPATGAPTEVRLNGKWFYESVDEQPKRGDTEIWQFINLTVDAHPMHMHLVQFQVLNRQPFDVEAYTTAWLLWVANGRDPATKPNLSNFLTGPATPPPPEELGWKDTAKSYPGEILRVVAKFDVPPLTVLPAEYVYHCHILEHEENEMMRPFQVVESSLAPQQQQPGVAPQGPLPAPTFIPSHR